jgi:hypothetical protein
MHQLYFGNHQHFIFLFMHFIFRILVIIKFLRLGFLGWRIFLVAARIRRRRRFFEMLRRLLEMNLLWNHL